MLNLVDGAVAAADQASPRSTLEIPDAGAGPREPSRRESSTRPGVVSERKVLYYRLPHSLLVQALTGTGSFIRKPAKWSNLAR